MVSGAEGVLPRGEVVGWALAGNVVVGLGAGTATLAAFQETLPLLGSQPLPVRVVVVAVGFALFFAGYRITQAGTYRDSGESLLGAMGLGGGHVDVDGFLLARGVVTVMGVVGLALGMTLFAQAIATQSLGTGFLSGLVCIGGYIFGHIGMNGTLL